MNLIAGREVVQELFGARFSYQQIHDELGKILHDTAYRQQMLDGYDEIIQMLGKPGASQRTAELILPITETLTSFIIFFCSIFRYSSI